MLPYGFSLRDLEIRAMKGELIPFEVDFQKPIEVYLGSSVMILSVSQLEQGIDLRQFISYMDYEYPVRIRFGDNRLLVSAEIKNSDGITIAKIVDNHWVVNEDNVIARDRNYNSYALEVIDSDLVPVLQVVLYPQNRIYIGGLIYFPQGRMLISPKVIVINPSSDQISEYIECIFKYPSEEFLGQMVKTSSSPILVYLGTSKSTWIMALGVILGALGLFLVPYGFEKQKGEKRKTKR